MATIEIKWPKGKDAEVFAAVAAATGADPSAEGVKAWLSATLRNVVQAHKREEAQRQADASTKGRREWGDLAE